jgi:hypothetical protein
MCGPQLVPRLSRVDSNTSVVDSLGDGIAVLTIGLFGAAGLGAEVADTLFPPRQTDGEACHPLWGLAGPLRAAGRGPCGVMRAPYGQAWRSCGTGVGAVANPGHSSPAPKGAGLGTPPRPRTRPAQGQGLGRGEPGNGMSFIIFAIGMKIGRARHALPLRYPQAWRLRRPATTVGCLFDYTGARIYRPSKTSNSSSVLLKRDGIRVGDDPRSLRDPGLPPSEIFVDTTSGIG